MHRARLCSPRPSAVDRARRTLGLVLRARLLAAGVVWAGCVGGGAAHGSGSPPHITADRHDRDALLPGGSWIATAAVSEVAVYADADDDQPIHRLASPDDNGTLT